MTLCIICCRYAFDRRLVRISKSTESTVKKLLQAEDFYRL